MLFGLLLALTVLALALVLGPWALRRLRAMRRYSDIPEVRWIGAGESPLGRRVLDCRGYCKLMPGPSRERVAARFTQTREAPLQELLGQLPEGAAADDGRPLGWRFNEGERRRLEAGFPAAAKDADEEDRWIIRYGEGRLYFQRSWTGALIYVAELEPDGSGARVTRLWLRQRDQGPEESFHEPYALPALHEAIARYLIDSHVLGRTAAVPVPAELVGEPQKMALFAFSIAGRRGEFAEPFWPRHEPINPDDPSALN